MYPWAIKKAPDFSSRGVAVPPPEPAPRFPRPDPPPAKVPVPFDYNKKIVPAFVENPAVAPAPVLRAAVPQVVSSYEPVYSTYSPATETFANVSTSYYVEQGSGGGGGGGVSSLNTLSGVVSITSDTLTVDVKGQQIDIEAPPLVGSLNGLNNDLTITSTTATITPDAITKTIAIEIPPGAGGVINLNSLVGSVALTSTDGTIAITAGALNSINFSAEPSIAGVASLNAETGDVVLTSTGGTIAITKPGGDTINLDVSGAAVDAWSTFSATSTIDAAHNDISNAKDIYCETIHGIGVDSGILDSLQILTDGNLHATTGTLTNIVTESKVLIQTTGGTNGHIILEANPGGNGSLNPGIVDVTANPSLSPDGSVGYGGTVNITANSAIGTNPALTQTSKVVVSGASVLSYAGYVNPILSTAGYNYTWGSLGVNIQSDVVPPIAPNVPGTVYIYGRLGTAIGTGTVLGEEYGLFTSLIQPYSDGTSRPDLVIKGKYTANVRLQDVSELVGDNCALSNISTINGGAYVPGSSWSGFAATGPVDFATFNLANVVNINSAPYVSGATWWLYPPTASLNMGAQDIYNASDITAANGDFTGLVEATIVGINNVNQIGYITKDTPGTGIQINSDNDISLRVGTAVGAPPGKVTNTGYYTTDILVPTNANELTTKQYVDSVSGVASLNSLTGALSITAGAGITITPSGSSVEVAMTQGPIKAYGNNTIAISAITTAAQNIAAVGGVITIGTSRLIGNATMTVQTNSNTIHDVTYYLTLNGAQIGAQMKHSFSGIGHWNTLAVTAIATGVAASPTNVFRLVALADTTSIFTVTAVNLNCTVDLA